MLTTHINGNVFYIYVTLKLTVRFKNKRNISKK